MLLALFLTAMVFALAVWGIAKAALALTRRLGIDPMTMLLWFGLAERPIEPRSQRARLGLLLADAPGSAPRPRQPSSALPTHATT